MPIVLSEEQIKHLMDDDEGHLNIVKWIPNPVHLRPFFAIWTLIPGRPLGRFPPHFSMYRKLLPNSTNGAV